MMVSENAIYSMSWFLKECELRMALESETLLSNGIVMTFENTIGCAYEKTIST